MITLETVMFNTITKKPQQLENFLLLACKTYIYSQKCQQLNVSLEKCEAYIENCRKCEYYNAKSTNNLNKYYQKWHNTNCKNNEVINVNENYTQQYVTDINIENFVV